MNDLLVNSYKLKDLAQLENKHPVTIKSGKLYSKNYIAIKFDNWMSKAMSKAWLQKKDYSVRYIRLKDLKEYIEKKTWKKLVLLDKKDL